MNDFSAKLMWELLLQFQRFYATDWGGEKLRNRLFFFHVIFRQSGRFEADF